MTSWIQTYGRDQPFTSNGPTGVESPAFPEKETAIQGRYLLVLGRKTYCKEIRFETGFCIYISPGAVISSINSTYESTLGCSPQQQPPRGDPCGPIFPTVTGSSFASQDLREEFSNHQILMPDHKA